MWSLENFGRDPKHAVQVPLKSVVASGPCQKQAQRQYAEVMI